MYARLVKRDRPISLREAEKLGLSFTLQISYIRESIWAQKAKIYKVQLDASVKGNPKHSLAQEYKNKNQCSILGQKYSDEIFDDGSLCELISRLMKSTTLKSS